MKREEWLRIGAQFSDVHKKFMDIFRGTFPKRTARRFGHCFYQTFVCKILPPDQFLADDDKLRLINAVPWLAGKRVKQRNSKYREVPLLERYPIGSLERYVQKKKE